jgi:hypothetical protein
LKYSLLRLGASTTISITNPYQKSHFTVEMQEQIVYNLLDKEIEGIVEVDQ